MGQRPGFQYGVCLDIFNFGDGSRYPSYDYKVNLEASAYSALPATAVNPFYSGDSENLHATLGCGLKVVMNRNFVISVEMAKALDERDGEKMWNNIGFNFLF